MAYEKQPPLGQALMAASLPVAIASNQSAIPTTNATTSVVGNGAAATAQRVTIANDSTGVIGTVGAVTAITNALPAGNNNIGDVDIASSVLPTGASTSANQTSEIALLTTIDGDTGNISTKIDTLAGAVSGTEMQVDVLTMPTTTVQATNLDIRDLVFATDKVDASGTVLGAGTNAIGKLAANSGVDIGDVDVTSVIPGTGATNLGKAEDAAHTTGDTGVFSLGVANEAQSSFGADGDYTPQATDVKGNRLVAGNIAHDGVDAGNPLKFGGKALSADPTAVATADRVNALFDLLGKQVVLPYAIPESAVSGAITSAMTGTTSTSLVAAPGSGLRNYITTIIVSNAHATVGTDVIIQDGSGGTTLMTIPAAALYGGAVITLPTPLRQPTTNTAIYCANVTTGASTKVSAVGFKAV